MVSNYSWSRVDEYDVYDARKQYFGVKGGE
jgi:hypothetical protein